MKTSRWKARASPQAVLPKAHWIGLKAFVVLWGHLDVDRPLCSARAMRDLVDGDSHETWGLAAIGILPLGITPTGRCTIADWQGAIRQVFSTFWQGLQPFEPSSWAASSKYINCAGGNHAAQRPWRWLHGSHHCCSCRYHIDTCEMLRLMLPNAGLRLNRKAEPPTCFRTHAHGSLGKCCLPNAQELEGCQQIQESVRRRCHGTLYISCKC